MQSFYTAGLVWFRRDLRSHDNAALHHALKSCRQVHCVFVFDKSILAGLPTRDRRVEFIRESVVELDAALRSMGTGEGCGLITSHAVAESEIPRLARELAVQAVFANHDDEPAALARDAAVRSALAQAGVAFHSFKDHVIFERREVLTRMGQPYSVFTPYKRAWLEKLDAFYCKAYPIQPYRKALAVRPPGFAQPVPSLDSLGFELTNLSELGIPCGARGAELLLDSFLRRIDQYGDARDFPAVPGPSYLSVHLRFGTVSIRRLVSEAVQRSEAGSVGAATWLSELIWRDFYFQVLANFPHIADAAGNGHSFKPDYDRIGWETGPAADALFEAWCEGRTGYPLVDAAMAQINQTGYMHNRLRMVVASFLSKDLGIDWRRGERWFALKLNDYDLSANNGGWQWAASSGCDAQPYFRIFNPVSQSRKFDAEGKFILRYLPQLSRLRGESLHAPWTAPPKDLAAAGVELGVNYPLPIVDHDVARKKTLQRYEAARSRNGP
jgi:deoxyribodipyrimidine photo-lyase